MAREAVHGIRIERAGDPDAGEILTVQRAAYATEAQVYADARLLALTQSLEELREELRQSEAFLPGQAGVTSAARPVPRGPSRDRCRGRPRR